MRNYLFLDDNHARHDQFIDFTTIILEGSDKKDQSIIHVHSYDTAIKQLSEPKEWEILFLDHDLSHEDEMCEPGLTNRFKTGTDLAYWIKDNNVDTKLIVLHSYNPVGRRTMSNILYPIYKIYEVPFGFPYPVQIVNLLR